MSILQPRDEEAVRKEFQRIAGPVKLVVFSQELVAQDLCRQNEQLIKEVAALSDRISVEVLNPVVDCSGQTANSQCATPADQFAAQSAAEDASSRAFGWIAAGIQINMGKLAVFGQYMLTSAAPNYLLSGTTHTVQGGIRYALAPAREEVGTQH